MTATPSRVDALITLLDDGLPLPAYEHPGDAGMDLRSRIDVELAPHARALVPTGVSIALPPGYVAQVCPRSGLALRHGIGLVNAPGIIDAGFRGEIAAILVNHDADEVFRVRRGDRIAQLVVLPVAQVVWHAVEELPGTHRSSGGFGSTGGTSQA